MVGSPSGRRCQKEVWTFHTFRIVFLIVRYFLRDFFGGDRHAVVHSSLVLGAQVRGHALSASCLVEALVGEGASRGDVRGRAQRAQHETRPARV